MVFKDTALATNTNLSNCCTWNCFKKFLKFFKPARSSFRDIPKYRKTDEYHTIYFIMAVNELCACVCVRRGRGRRKWTVLTRDEDRRMELCKDVIHSIAWPNANLSMNSTTEKKMSRRLHILKKKKKGQYIQHKMHNYCTSEIPLTAKRTTPESTAALINWGALSNILGSWRWQCASNSLNVVDNLAIPVYKRGGRVSSCFRKTDPRWEVSSYVSKRISTQKFFKSN